MKTFFLGNDAEPEYLITRKNATTGAVEPATGLTGLTVRLSATDGGATVHANLSVACSERGTLGIYFGTWQGSDLTAANTATITGTAYMVFADSGLNVLISEAVQLHAVRRPD